MPRYNVLYATLAYVVMLVCHFLGSLPMKKLAIPGNWSCDVTLTPLFAPSNCTRSTVGGKADCWLNSRSLGLGGVGLAVWFLVGVGREKTTSLDAKKTFPPNA